MHAGQTVFNTFWQIASIFFLPVVNECNANVHTWSLLTGWTRLCWPLVVHVDCIFQHNLQSALNCEEDFSPVIWWLTFAAGDWTLYVKNQSTRLFDAFPDAERLFTVTTSTVGGWVGVTSIPFVWICLRGMMQCSAEYSSPAKKYKKTILTNILMNIKKKKTLAP